MISAVAAVTASSVDNQNVTTGAIATTGATLIVVGVSDAAGQPATTLADSKSNTWVEIGTEQTTTFIRHRMFYCLNPTVDAAHTFSATSVTNTFPSISVEAYKGIYTPAAFDQTNKAGGNTISSLATGSVTPTFTSELIVTTTSCDNGVASIDGGFTIASETNATAAGFSAAIARLIQTSIAAANPTWTYDGVSTSAAAKIATFRAANSGLMMVF